MKNWGELLLFIATLPSAIAIMYLANAAVNAVARDAFFNAGIHKLVN